MVKRNKCYICGAKNIIDIHHIIPQAFGGESGPTVALCASCHSGIHREAVQAISKKKLKKKYFTDEQAIRALPLIEIIIISIRKARENIDKDDKATLMVKPEKRVIELLHVLKTDAGFTNLNDFVIYVLKSYIVSRI